MKYTVASLIELPKLDRYGFDLMLDGEPHAVEANLIAIANTVYFGGGMKIAPQAQFDDGQLDVVLIGPAPRATFASVLPLVFSGRHVRSRHVTTYRARSVELRGIEASLRADGEQFGRLPATLSVEPKALLVAGIGRP